MRKHFVFILDFTIILLLIACSKENNTSDNYQTDIVITGDAMTGATYAIIDGYANLNLLNIGSSTIEYGIEISQTEDFSNSKIKTTREIEGNKIKILINNLKSKKKYFYRVFLRTNGNTYYGKPNSFSTIDFMNYISTNDISNITELSQVNIHSSSD